MESRYELRDGKFGHYFYDSVEDQDMSLEEVLHFLNKKDNFNQDTKKRESLLVSLNNILGGLTIPPLDLDKLESSILDMLKKTTPPVSKDDFRNEHLARLHFLTELAHAFEYPESDDCAMLERALLNRAIDLNKIDNERVATIKRQKNKIEELMMKLDSKRDDDKVSEIHGLRNRIRELEYRLERVKSTVYMSEPEFIGSFPIRKDIPVQEKTVGNSYTITVTDYKGQVITTVKDVSEIKLNEGRELMARSADGQIVGGSPKGTLQYVKVME